MTKSDKLYLTGKLRSEPELLDADMTRADLGRRVETIAV